MEVKVMYVDFEDLRSLFKNENIAENPGIFIEYMGRCFEPDEIKVDEDGDIIISI